VGVGRLFAKLKLSLGYSGDDDEMALKERSALSFTEIQPILTKVFPLFHSR